MSPHHTAVLLLIAAIWGGAFVALRAAVADLGPLFLSFVRVLIAAGAMLVYLRLMRLSMSPAAHWRPMLVIGVFGAGLPFPLFAIGATQLPAGVLAVINATVPLWGALIAWLWLGERLTLLRAAGLAIGLAGVVLLVQGNAQLGTFELNGATLLAAIASLGATLCFAIGGVATKRLGAQTHAAVLATGVLIVATLMMLPLVPLAPPARVSGAALANAAALGLFASALGTVLFLRLVHQIGPTPSMTVTFLVPVFGIAWAWLLLQEVPTAATLLGCATILLGTGIVLWQKPPLPVPVE